MFHLGHTQEQSGTLLSGDQKGTTGIINSGIGLPMSNWVREPSGSDQGSPYNLGDAGMQGEK